MRCIYCNCAESKVVDSRSTDDGTVIRRRRMCVECGRRFTTYEKIEEVPFVVIKRNGSRQTFSTSKILAGIKKPVKSAYSYRAAAQGSRRCGQRAIKHS